MALAVQGQRGDLCSQGQRQSSIVKEVLDEHLRALNFSNFGSHIPGTLLAMLIQQTSPCNFNAFKSPHCPARTGAGQHCCSAQLTDSLEKSAFIIHSQTFTHLPGGRTILKPSSLALNSF